MTDPPLMCPNALYVALVSKLIVIQVIFIYFYQCNLIHFLNMVGKVGKIKYVQEMDALMVALLLRKK